MKKTILFFAMLLLVAGCKKNQQGLAPVKVHVNNFSVVQEEFPTKGDPVGTYTGVKFFTLAFYAADGTELYNHTQERADATTYETFGEFECSLPMGTHTMVVLGYGGDAQFNLTSPTLATFTDSRLRDTFVKTQSVTISNNNGVEVSASLDRVVSMLGVVSTDNRTVEATKIRMTFTGGGQNFNPTTGLATTNTGFANTLAFVESPGTTIMSASFLFLDTDEQTMNITIETLDDDDNVLYAETLNDVPFQRNRRTVLTGKVFTDGASASSFVINSDWLDDYNGPL